jgi:hypothetical protein
VREPSLRLMRNSAAALLLLSGLIHLGGLWFNELSARALLAALFGSAYLLIAIGLLGISRFTLFVAMAVPATGAGLSLRYTPLLEMTPLGFAQVLVNGLVCVLCATVLWQVRNDPSV